MRILSFKKFSKLYEFEISGHYKDRSSLDIEAQKKLDKKRGSRLLPIGVTPATGFKIDFLRETKSRETLDYTDWLEMYELDQADFESFIGKVWNYQLLNPSLINIESKPGTYYAIKPGVIYLQTEDSSIWRISFSTGEVPSKEPEFISYTSNNVLTTLISISDVSDEALRKRHYENIYRTDTGNFKQRFPDIRNFKLDVNFFVVDLDKSQIIIKYRGNPSDLEKAKAIIDSAYSGITLSEPVQMTSFIATKKIPGVTPIRRELREGFEFIYHGGNGEYDNSYRVKDILNMQDIKSAYNRKELDTIDQIDLKVDKRYAGSYSYVPNKEKVSLFVGDEISILLRDEKDGLIKPHLYYITRLINSEPKIINADKVQMWLYPIKYKYS